MQGRMGTSYNDWLFNRINTDAVGDQSYKGYTGYYATPQKTLDPRIVDLATDKVRPEIREQVLNLLYGFWRKRYHDPEAWSTVWIAGSALAYQWDRGAPDLDVLIGVNDDKFRQHNPALAAIPEDLLDTRFNKEFDNELEPFTKDFHGFETTFYVNPGGTDIRAINPYAAFNLTTNEWTVRPIVVPEDWNPDTHLPGFRSAVQPEIEQAKYLIGEYHKLTRTLKNYRSGTPGWTNVLNQLQRNVINPAAALFTDIHEGRQNAFRPGGKGYMDYYNYRWQAHKNAGTIEPLHAIKVVDVRSHVANQIAQYGEPLLDADSALIRSALWGTPYYRDAVQWPMVTNPAPLPGEHEDDSKIPKKLP